MDWWGTAGRDAVKNLHKGDKNKGDEVITENPDTTGTQYLGKEGEDPSLPFYASGNYVGPNWSNGKKQSSVKWGNLDPINALDALARQHDTAYATWSDRAHREAADEIFAAEANKLKKRFGNKFAEDPKFAAGAVQYGNYAHRQTKKLWDDVMWGNKILPGMGALTGVLKFGLGNIKEMHQRLKGTYHKKELEDVLKLYREDPKPSRYLSRGESTRHIRELDGRTPTHKGTTVTQPLGKVRESKRKPTGPTQVLPIIVEEAPTLAERQLQRFNQYSQTYKNAQKPGRHTYHKGIPLGAALPEHILKKKRKKIKKNQVRPL